MKTALFTLTLAALLLAGTAQAELPIPEVSYDRTVPGLALTFTIDGFFPPTGAVAWEIAVTRDGQTNLYPVTPVTREVFIRTPILRPGTYFIQAFITDEDQEVMDYRPLFDWTLQPPSYRADIPIVAVGGQEWWDTGISIVAHGQDEAVNLKVVVYDQTGAWRWTQEVTLEPHAAYIINFSHLVRQFMTVEPPAMFAGSATVWSPVPAALTYQARPYNPATTAPGIAFGMVLNRED